MFVWHPNKRKIQYERKKTPSPNPENQAKTSQIVVGNRYLSSPLGYLTITTTKRYGSCSFVESNTLTENENAKAIGYDGNESSSQHTRPACNSNEATRNNKHSDRGTNVSKWALSAFVELALHWRTRAPMSVLVCMPVPTVYALCAVSYSIRFLPCALSVSQSFEIHSIGRCALSPSFAYSVRCCRLLSRTFAAQFLSPSILLERKSMCA